MGEDVNVISQWLINKQALDSVLGGAAIAFAGAAVLFGPDAIHNGISGHLASYSLALLAGCCWALY